MCDRCDELEEEVRQLRELLSGRADLDVDPAWKLSPAQRRIFAALANRRGKIVSKEHLQTIAALSFHDLEDPDNTLKTQVHCLRKRLAKAGGPKVMTAWGGGYYLEAAPASGEPLEMH